MQHTKITLRTLLLALLAQTLFFTACKDDSDDTVEENITKVVVSLTTVDGQVREFKWEDADGPGGNAPAVDSILLPQSLAGTANTLSGELRIFDGATDLTAEIKAEKNAHLFVYNLTGTALAQLAYDDADDNNEKFGLKTRWVVNTGTGSVNIKLYHEPTDKTNAAAPGGDVDFDVTFPVKIQ